MVARSCIFAWLCLLPACTPSYILRAGYEEAKILWYRRPIADLLREPGRLDPATRDKFQIVLRVRAFAEQDLGFRVGQSYRSVSDPPSPPTLYVVTAAPPTRLVAHTWWFPIVGRVSYKGYFERAQAVAEARRLAAHGFDTYMRTAAAFSTLGWFADPLLPQLLEYDQATLATIILHELFHNTFYLPGQTAFNESLANFAGYRGALAFFVKAHGETHALAQHLRAAWKRQLAVSHFLEQARRRLTRLYTSALTDEEKLTRRKDVFARLQEGFHQLSGTGARTSDFASGQLNNAVIVHYLTYLRDLRVFERMYEQNDQDLRQTLDAIAALAEDAERPFEAVRRVVH